MFSRESQKQSEHQRNIENTFYFILKKIKNNSTNERRERGMGSRGIEGGDSSVSSHPPGDLRTDKCGGHPTRGVTRLLFKNSYNCQDPVSLPTRQNEYSQLIESTFRSVPSKLQTLLTPPPVRPLPSPHWAHCFVFVVRNVLRTLKTY